MSQCTRSQSSQSGRGCAHANDSNRSTSLNNVDQDDSKRDHQENVNEAAERIGRDDAKQPENQQNYKYCPEHFYSFRRSCPFFLPTPFPFLCSSVFVHTPTQ